MISSVDIAKETNINHASIVKLACKYKYVLKEFGDFELKQVPSSQGHGGRPKEVVKLNDNQAIVIIFLLRNTEKTVYLKTKNLKKLLEEGETIG
ncbi:MAG: Rha family transcriptional regulator [Clostridiales bacterium]